MTSLNAQTLINSEMEASQLKQLLDTHRFASFAVLQSVQRTKRPVQNYVFRL